MTSRGMASFKKTLNTFCFNESGRKTYNGFSEYEGYIQGECQL